MTIHAQSVIPTWVNTWDSTLYTSLTSQENDAYTRGGLNIVANWQPLFQTLVTALTNWKTVNRQSLLSDFISSAYGYLVLNTMYATDGSLISSFSAPTIFGMNGFTAACKGRALTFYGDLIGTGPYTSAKITADIATINGASALETSTVNSLKTSIQGFVSAHVSKTLFQDIIPTNSFPGKDGMATQVFTTLGYKKVYQTLNIGNLVLPPGV